MGNIIITIALLVLWMHALSKWFVYYASLTGLLYHISITFGENNMPDAKRMEEIKDYAIERIANDLIKNKAKI